MKRILGTVVLFVLLVLAVIALVQMDTGDHSAFKAKDNAPGHATN